MNTKQFIGGLIAFLIGLLILLWCFRWDRKDFTAQFIYDVLSEQTDWVVIGTVGMAVGVWNVWEALYGASHLP